MKAIKVSMTMEIEDGSEEAIKRIENHAEELLDLDEWPEIKSVYNVRVRDIQELDTFEQ